VDHAVLATANELYEARQFPGVIAVVTDALEDEPDCVALLLLRARAHIALRRNLDAQADLRDIIRIEPQRGIAYRLLGELAARRDENESAAIFFREALRLDPGDQEASDWLLIVETPARPAAAAQKLPAPAAAAGRFPPARGPVQRGRTANDGQPRSVSAPARTAQRPGSQPRFATGTQPPPDDERPTHRYGARPVAEPAALPSPPTPGDVRPLTRSATGSSPHLDVAARPSSSVPTLAGAQPVRRPFAQVQMRGPLPELPGFGDYLVSTGILSRERLRAAQAYQRSMKVQLSTAIVTLGLATPQRIEWAVVAHQSQLARER
jgi:tetratricopeptide (TPR) repeat protein